MMETTLPPYDILGYLPNILHLNKLSSGCKTGILSTLYMTIFKEINVKFFCKLFEADIGKEMNEGYRQTFTYLFSVKIFKYEVDGFNGLNLVAICCIFT